MEETKPVEDTWLTGRLLVATPGMPDPRFERAVIYICSHSSGGAMGLIVNRLFGGLPFKELLDQMGIQIKGDTTDHLVHLGGPIEAGRGFVLHTTDWVHDGTVTISDNIALTATVDILRAIADGQGPSKSLFALGYVGWSAGQLEQEMQANGWLVLPADEALLFDVSPARKWEDSLAKAGINAAMLTGDMGHA